MKRSSPRPKSDFLSGYIEGYYGRLLTFPERRGMVEKLGKIGAGHYLYAPKEDPFHRRDWRKSYPADWRDQFRAFTEHARRQKISVAGGIAPGLSYRYREPKDFEALTRKFRALVETGCTELALLMDDIPVDLSEGDRGAFRSLGEAHAQLLQKLWARLKRSGGIRRLWFCPTVYSDFVFGGGVRDEAYLRDLAPGLSQGVELLWTGPAIVSPHLEPENVSRVTRALGRKPVLWDNFYANDYCPGRIFLGPFQGRPADLREAAAGLLLNPTGLYHTDLFLLDLLGGFLRGHAPAETWKLALIRNGIPDGFSEVVRLLASPFEPMEPGSWTRNAVLDFRRALKPLIWDWKSPLQREWYPYLYAVDADLRLLLAGEEAPDSAWIRKKYSPIVASFLTGHFADRK